MRHPTAALLPSARHFLPRLLLLVTLLGASLATGSLRAEAVSLTGVYENEGSIVDTVADYSGPVSLSALLGLEFDLALGRLKHAEVATVAIDQQLPTFTVRTRKADGSLVWTGTWKRNGGYEPTDEGAKIMLRARGQGGAIYLFTLSKLKEGTALLVKIEQVESDRSGPIGKLFGNFLFLRSQPGA